MCSVFMAVVQAQPGPTNTVISRSITHRTFVIPHMLCMCRLRNMIHASVLSSTCAEDRAVLFSFDMMSGLGIGRSSTCAEDRAVLFHLI